MKKDGSKFARIRRKDTFRGKNNNLAASGFDR